MADWENKPLSEYDDNPWGKTILTKIVKPSAQTDGFAELAAVRYDRETGQRIDDEIVHWNLGQIKAEKQRLEKELNRINARVDYVQTAIQAQP